MIGALHEFHDKTYSQEWAQRFETTPERDRLFTDMAALLDASIPPEATILELGIGPGYLAHYLLNRFKNIKYIGLDFSKPMLDIASERLNAFHDRLQLIQGDLVKNDFVDLLTDQVQGVVSTWALHDLGNRENTNRVYEQVSTILKGILINGDFIKPEGIGMDFEAGRFELSQHMEVLKQIGYNNASCYGNYEIELENPTAAQNYACLVAYYG